VRGQVLSLIINGMLDVIEAGSPLDFVEFDPEVTALNAHLNDFGCDEFGEVLAAIQPTEFE